MAYSSQQANKVMDLYAWMFVQAWFMPYYMIGKQDEWKQWTNVSLNGWRMSNLCKP